MVTECWYQRVEKIEIAIVCRMPRLGELAKPAALGLALLAYSVGHQRSADDDAVSVATANLPPSQAPSLGPALPFAQNDIFLLCATVQCDGLGYRYAHLRFPGNILYGSLTLEQALYLTRSRWMPLLPIPDHIYQRLPSSFTGDLEAGLSSSQFDIAANIADGDTRAGLDQIAKQEVRKIMKNRKVNFDEARRIYTESRFARNNIGPDGRPRDPKFVSFS